MRKRLITPTTETVRFRGEGWLDVERAAGVEVTSEDDDSPVESAFVSGEARGWRAAVAGSQTIRLVFDQPQRLRRISLELAARYGESLPIQPDSGALNAFLQKRKAAHAVHYAAERTPVYGQFRALQKQRESNNGAPPVQVLTSAGETANGSKQQDASAQSGKNGGEPADRIRRGR